LIYSPLSIRNTSEKYRMLLSEAEWDEFLTISTL